MPDEPVYMPEWLATLHCPICGDVNLSRVWKRPDYLASVLGGFGPRHPPARRWIVLTLDTMAINHWLARQNEPAFNVQDGKEHFAATSKAARKLLNKLREPQVRRAILMAMVKCQRERRGPKWVQDMDLHTGGPLHAIDVVLEFIGEGAEEVLRNPDLYYAMLCQPPIVDSRKSLESALIWNPLLDLMHDFGIENFSRYQDLTQTVRSLHFALGIDPPNTNRLKQVVFGWRKRQLDTAA
jgi:hypothetical protein